MQFNQFLFKVRCITLTIMLPIIFFLFQGFTETTLMPLQASTILLRADQRRAALNPPLLPISHNQVRHGELATLLTEEDYNLSTMVNHKFHFYYFALKITSLIPTNLLFVTLFNLTLCLLYSLIYCLVLHSHTGYYTPSYIFCLKYLSTFSHISPSSMLIILHC